MDYLESYKKWRKSICNQLNKDYNKNFYLPEFENFGLFLIEIKSKKKKLLNF